MNYEIGQIVKSTAGRDLGNYFIVLDVDDTYLYLVDGKSRRLESPKKKKKKHVQVTNDTVPEIANKIINGNRLTNAEIRRGLKEAITED